MPFCVEALSKDKAFLFFDLENIAGGGARSPRRMKRPSRGPVSSNESQLPQVLIVDDNADAAMSLAMLLELEDIVAACVGDAEAALRFVQDTRPALLLIDIGLPGMDGYDLARALRQMPSLAGSTLIALTGREGDGVSIEGTVFDQFWTKPFEPKQLLSEVRRILGSD